MALFDSYFWPFNKTHEKIVAIFVISAIMASIWNVLIKFRWHDEKLTWITKYKWITSKIAVMRIQNLFYPNGHPQISRSYVGAAVLCSHVHPSIRSIIHDLSIILLGIIKDLMLREVIRFDPRCWIWVKKYFGKFISPKPIWIQFS